MRLFYVSVARSGSSFTRLWRSVTPLSACSLKRASWSVSGSNPSFINLILMVRAVLGIEFFMSGYYAGFGFFSLIFLHGPVMFS